MMRAILLIALLGLAACETAQRTSEDIAPPPPPPPAAPALGGVAASRGEVRVDCPLTIAFASYGAGIDNPVRERVQSMLVGDHAVTGFDAQRWGREGEVTLCVRTRAGPDAARLFHQARSLIPAQPRGPISLRTLDGLSYETPALRH